MRLAGVGLAAAAAATLTAADCVPPAEAPVADAGPDRYALVGETVTLPAPDGPFVWDFGDGSTGVDVSTHAWTEPGHYRAILSVLGEGRSAADDVLVTVHHPPAQPAPRSSAPVASAAGLVFAVMPDFGLVAVVDAASREVVRHVAVCSEPRSVAADATTFAVACADDRLVVHEHGGDLVTEWPLPPGSRPFGVLLEPLAATLQGTGELWVDGDGIPLGPDPRGLAALDGAFLASRHRSPADRGVVWSWQGSQIVERPLSKDPGPDSDTGSRGVPNYVQTAAWSPDGTQVVFGGLQANTERGVYRDGLALTHDTTARAMIRMTDADGVEIAAHAFDGRDFVSAAAWSPRGDLLAVAFLGHASVQVLDPWRLEPLAGLTDVGEGPDGLLFSEDGAELWVLASLSRELVVVDVSELAAPATELARLDLRPPSGEVLEPAVLRGKQLFHAAHDRRLTLDGYLSCASCHLDGDQDGRVWDFTDRGEGLRNTITLHGRAGTAHGPIHWTGNFDEVQDFENDIRGPMQGAGFLDEADWEEAADTLGPPKAGRSADLDALAAYVASLDTVPRPPLQDPARVSAGRALFEDPALGCAGCHPGPEYTDSRFEDGEPVLHDVGTLTDASGQRLGGPLDGLDTPTLRGVFETAPYLHDGSAATLRAVLVDRNPDDLHGVTSGLSEEQLDALVAFLASLE